MSHSDAIRTRLVEFEAADGAELVGDLVRSDRVRAAAIVCHPHPSFGGNRHHPVVTTTADSLAAEGVAALRFDFRARFDDGVGARLDAIAAVDLLATEFPDVALFAVGYSFGALVAMSLRDRRVDAQVLIAPPLAAVHDVEAVRVPTLVLVPAHDQFSPPDATDSVLDAWRDTTAVPIDREIVESADHSLTGHAATVASRTTRWLGDRG